MMNHLLNSFSILSNNYLVFGAFASNFLVEHFIEHNANMMVSR